MKSPFLLPVYTLCLLLCGTNLHAETFRVGSQAEFNAAQNAAVANDSIIWLSGTYSDVVLEITKDRIVFTAEILGGTIFTGASRMRIYGDFITFRGFQFVGGDIGTRHVIDNFGSNNLFTQLNIRNYTCYKYFIIREESRYVEVTYSNFENRLNLADQNILSILVDENVPGYHKIRYCSFKNFDGNGNDDGIEPIRIGLSTQADHISRALVEYCYFTQCNGDGELISGKASQIVYRFNTFEDNPKAELVLRHGSEAIVYGNFFLNNKGGVRVREGQNHYLYNNYFQGLADRAIFLQNDDSDPLDNINIAFNTIVDCDDVRLGGDGDDQPTNVTFANNIFADPEDNLFDDPTGTETWIGNLAFGDLGLTLPASGITVANPQLSQNSEGFFGLSATSPAIDAAQPGYASLPQFPGMDPVDTAVDFDLMGQSRPATITEKDLGCSEYPRDVMIRPYATEENTGPSYNSSTLTSTPSPVQEVSDLLSVLQNPVMNRLTITARTDRRADLEITLYSLAGQKIRTIANQDNFTGELTLTTDLTELGSGLYALRGISRDRLSGLERVQTLRILKIR